jgi:hypothetical protein
MEVPMWLVYLAIPLGSGLMCFRFLQVAWGFLQTGELPHHDAAHVEGVAKLSDEDLLLSKLEAEDNLHPVAPTRKG